MLGALLASLPVTHPPDFPDMAQAEVEGDDGHWSNDKNRFEDWFLHGDAPDGAAPDPEIYY